MSDESISGNESTFAEDESKLGEKTFGSFIRQKRLALDPHISLRKMAELLNLSPVHMSNIETGREAAPKNDVLINLAKQLKLDKQETELMYDLSAL